jgi:hypothetical protein
MSVARSQRVTKADVEAKLRKLQGDVEGKVMSQRQKIIGAGIAAAVMALFIAYLLGKRRGKRKTTVVEIRRI